MASFVDAVDFYLIDSVVYCAEIFVVRRGTDTVYMRAEITFSYAAQTFVKNRCGYERDGSFTTDRQDGWQYYDCGIAAQTFCLAAHDMGLGTVIMGVFDRLRLQEYLQVPEDQELMALIAVGYPAQVGPAPKRKGVDVLLSWK